MSDTGDGRPASLEEVLLEREARAAVQSRLASRHAAPVVSLSLVTPGPVKDDARKRLVMDRAARELEAVLSRNGHSILEAERRDGPAGPSFIAALSAPAGELKRLCVGLEDGLAWGRALDIDVVALPASSPFPEPFTRAGLGLGPRRCLLCGRPARECMAARTHDVAQLAAAAEAILALAAGEAG